MTASSPVAPDRLFRDILVTFKSYPFALVIKEHHVKSCKSRLQK